MQYVLSQMPLPKLNEKTLLVLNKRWNIREIVHDVSQIIRDAPVRSLSGSPASRLSALQDAV